MKSIEQTTRPPHQNEKFLVRLKESVAHYFSLSTNIITTIPGNIRVRLNKFIFENTDTCNEWLFSPRINNAHPCEHISEMFTFLYRRNSPTIKQFENWFIDEKYSKKIVFT